MSGARFRTGSQRSTIRQKWRGRWSWEQAPCAEQWQCATNRVWGGLLPRLLRGKSVATADREWVILLPMTPHVTAWFEAHSADDVRWGEREIGGLNPEVWQYAGRVRTDSQGNFQFDGLMPGRYLVLAHFPVEYTARRTYATGEYSVEYSYSPMFGSGSGAIKPITRTERYQSQMYVWISEVVDVKPGVPTIFMPPVRDLI